MRDYQIISADSHVVEPPDLWEKWLERKYLDTAPRARRRRRRRRRLALPRRQGSRAARSRHLRRYPARRAQVDGEEVRREHPPRLLRGEGSSRDPRRRRSRRGDSVSAAAGDAHVHEEHRQGRASRRHPRIQPLAEGRLLRRGSGAADRDLPDAERRHRDLGRGARAREEGGLPRGRDLGLARRRRQPRAPTTRSGTPPRSSTCR